MINTKEKIIFYLKKLMMLELKFVRNMFYFLFFLNKFLVIIKKQKYCSEVQGYICNLKVKNIIYSIIFWILMINLSFEKKAFASADPESYCKGMLSGYPFYSLNYRSKINGLANDWSQNQEDVNAIIYMQKCEGLINSGAPVCWSGNSNCEGKSIDPSICNEIGSDFYWNRQYGCCSSQQHCVSYNEIDPARKAIQECKTYSSEALNYCNNANESPTVPKVEEQGTDAAAIKAHKEAINLNQAAISSVNKTKSQCLSEIQKCLESCRAVDDKGFWAQGVAKTNECLAMKHTIEGKANTSLTTYNSNIQTSESAIESIKGDSESKLDKFKDGASKVADVGAKAAPLVGMAGQLASMLFGKGGKPPPGFQGDTKIPNPCDEDPNSRDCYCQTHGVTAPGCNPYNAGTKRLSGKSNNSSLTDKDLQDILDEDLGLQEAQNPRSMNRTDGSFKGGGSGGLNTSGTVGQGAPLNDGKRSQQQLPQMMDLSKSGVRGYSQGYKGSSPYDGARQDRWGGLTDKEKEKINLKDFLPGGAGPQRDPAALKFSQISGANGPSNFEKVRKKYSARCPLMYDDCI